MTMSMLPAYFTSTNLKKRKSKIKQSLTAHDKWLISKGLSYDQIKSKKTVDFKWKERYLSDMKVDRSDYVSAGMSGNASSCTKRGVMVNLHKEPKHVRDAIIDKASRVMPLFNKGGLQYATPETDMTTVGSKSRRG